MSIQLTSNFMQKVVRQILPKPGLPLDPAEKGLLKQVDDAGATIANAPASDALDQGDTRTVYKQGDLLRGSLHRASWAKEPDRLSATLKHGDSTVELTSETFKKDNSGLYAAAVGTGSVLGVILLAGLGKSSSQKSALPLGLAAALGGLAAWGVSRKTFNGPGERRIERVETNAEGITKEKLTLQGGGSKGYSRNWHRIGPPPEFDQEKAEAFINSIDLKGLPTYSS